MALDGYIKEDIHEIMPIYIRIERFLVYYEGKGNKEKIEYYRKRLEIINELRKEIFKTLPPMTKEQSDKLRIRVKEILEKRKRAKNEENQRAETLQKNLETLEKNQSNSNNI